MRMEHYQNQQMKFQGYWIKLQESQSNLFMNHTITP